MAADTKPSATSAQAPTAEPIHKAKFRNVLGLASPTRPTFSDQLLPQRLSTTSATASRRSADSGSQRRKKTKQAAVDDSFFEVVDPRQANPDSVLHEPLPTRRGPLRMDAQDGPWSVSVADHPHDKRSYTLYIKTPTHNLTLTRSTTEIIELHNKLRDSHPNATLPRLPLDASATVAVPVKRKSAFFSTLSRLTSPATSKAGRSSGGRSSSTPMASPMSDAGDSASSLASGAPANAPTSLAAYLTTLANDQVLRHARAWRRFVRVRTDDLESVRVERAIKRTRSDLAAHVSPKPTTEPAMKDITEAPAAVDVEHLGWGGEDSEVEAREPDVPRPVEVIVVTNGETIKQEIEEAKPLSTPRQSEDRGPVEEAADERPSSRLSSGTSKALPAQATPPEEAKPAPSDAEDQKVEEEAQEEDVSTSPQTPTVDTHVPRIPRSLSAEHIKGASRLSRVMASAADTSVDTATDTDVPSEAGDEELPSKSRRDRKKSARSADPAAKARRSRKVVVDDFEMLRVLGKGCAGKVLLVRHKQTTDLYALKAITKRHVLAHQELQHTLTEQAVLKRMAAENSDPFVVKLWWSFHDKENLFLVMDFHPGGDLATQLARWGRLGRDRARFYAAEIVEGVEGLHAAGVIYRDLKPENVLIGGDGHIVLTDFGLSKEFPRRTATITAPATPTGARGEFLNGSAPSTPQGSPPWMKKGGDMNGWPGPVGQGDMTGTFCGTAEYLAPEVIQGLQYSFEVDWWSFGTMLYEMLTGITPFWANNHADMYVRVLQDELTFPEDRTMDQDTKSLLRGLLQRNPGLRLSEPRIKKHPYFSMIDWSHVYYKRYIPPYIPPIDPENAGDTQNFDDTFLEMKPVVNDPDEVDPSDASTDRGEQTETDTDRTDDDSVPTPSQSRSPSVHPPEDDSVDVFDGYSFKGRHSVLIEDDDDDNDDASSSSSGTDTEEEEAMADLPAETPVADGVKTPVERTTPEPPQQVVVEEEPKTPEARSTPLPEAVPEMPLSTEVTVPEAVVPQGITPQGPLTPAEKPQDQVEDATPVVAVSADKELRDELAAANKAYAALDAQAPEPAETAPQPAVPAAGTKAPVTEESRESLDVVPPMPPKATTGRSTVGRPGRGRREKSGVPALDRYLSGDEEPTDLDDDDWDFVEAGAGEERNGVKGTSLFARGVVDRYKLAVFRKGGTTPQRVGARSVSGMSETSLASPGGVEPPSPSVKQRRGRNQGLNFRRHPKEFLRARSPPSSKAKSMHQSVASALAPSATSSVAGLSTTSALTPSPSGAPSTLSPASPSLRTKESTISVSTTPSMSSDQSADGSPGVGEDATATLRSPYVNEAQPKNKKMKKYKEGAEKVLSLFTPQRPSPTA